MILATTLITIGFAIYFIITMVIMRYTLGYKTLNNYAFRRGYEKKDLMHYVEMAITIILIIGFITTIISLIQIIFLKRKK